MYDHKIKLIIAKYISMYKIYIIFYRYTLRSDKQVKSLEKAIEMCINSLSYDLQKNYQDFSLFVPDLNIKPEVITLYNITNIFS